METEKYRFETGSLYKYDADSNAYIHVWRFYRDDTKAKAIKAYERDQEDQLITGEVLY